METQDIMYGGKVLKNVPSASVLVTAETDLAELAGYPPGTIAYTAGFKAMWQLDAFGDWISIL